MCENPAGAVTSRPAVCLPAQGNLAASTALITVRVNQSTMPGKKGLLRSAGVCSGEFPHGKASWGPPDHHAPAATHGLLKVPKSLRPATAAAQTHRALYCRGAHLRFLAPPAGRRLLPRACMP
ncbi:hypothetical protein GUJ93_ZPchr0009g995 [Zizania palustris]|uniref:Uncharacterized protein n=1 Tax=Zizania palustris TaxID=103762 RepID=A0A8J5V8J2_ZIZPA|nr:hypothetical protein GUJ93_ZPchr0009g995 [Zizania palustris]